MNRIVTRLRSLFTHAPLGFTATVSAADAFAPGVSTLHEGAAHRRWTPVMPLRLANGVLAHQLEAEPDPSINKPQQEPAVWCWQSAEGLDKPLAYSR